MTELIEGVQLMLIGMGVVFSFLIILVIMMKLIPIITKKRNKVQDVSRVQPDPAPIDPAPMNAPLVLGTDAEQARKIAAISAAVTATIGKIPKRFIVTTPVGEVARVYNAWSYAGHQDLMEVGALQGQRGFQY